MESPGHGGTSAHGGSAGKAGSGAGGSGARGGSGATAESGGTSSSGANGSGGTSSGGSGGKGGGRGGSTGAGGAGGTAGTEAGFGGEAGSAASGATGGSSTGGTSGSAGAGTSSGGAGSGGATAGMSGGGQGGAGVTVTENEPDDDRSSPMPIASTGAVEATFATSTDNDYFEVVTPEGDLAGGYYTFTITDIPDGRVAFEVLSEVDYNPVLQAESGAVGSALFGYWSSAPGQRFLIHEAPKSASSYPYAYKLHVTYAALPDAGEPDDTRQKARSIDVGEAVQGYMFAGFLGSSVDVAEYSDFYAVSLAAGSYTIHVGTVPSTVNIEIFVYDSNGSGLVQSWNATAGADFVDSRTAATAGTYYIEVTYFNARVSPAATTSLPDDVPEQYTQPYTLTVTQ